MTTSVGIMMMLLDRAVKYKQKTKYTKIGYHKSLMISDDWLAFVIFVSMK